MHGSRALGEPRSTSWSSWRQQVHDLDMQSSVHPKYKTKYHVGNWPAYDRALVQRGDITVWLAPDVIAAWEAVGVGTRGGQLQYSDLAIETALTLRLIFHLPLRQTEGFLTSIFGMLGLDLSAPDHTTLSRRGQHLDLTLRRAPTGAGLHLIVDSTGLSIVGEGEWAAAKHGGRGRRGWKKLHLGVDRSGVIVARALTEASVDDATTGITLIEAVDGALGRVTADAAYDTIGFYEAAGARGATVVVPPTSTAHVSRHGPRSSARDRTILVVKERGRRRWKKTSGYHGQARVENAFFRYKSIIGDSLRACSPAGRGTEVDLACNILSVSNSLSGRHWELDQVPVVGDPTDIVQLGTGHHVSAGEGRVAAYLVVVGQTPGPRNVASILDSARELGIRDAQVEAHHPEQGVQEPFGLAQREMVEEPQGQGGLDGKIRVPPLPAPPAAPAGHPGSDRFRGQPHRHIAASNEGPVIGRPVRNAVLRLVRGMDLRLHPCSVALAEGPEKCGPRRPTRNGYSCNNALQRSPGAVSICGAVCGRSRPARASISCSTARVCPSSGQVSGRPRNTVAAAGVAGGSSTLASISQA